VVLKLNFMKMDYSPKDLAFADDGRVRLMRGVSKMADAVKSTLGPGGNTVLIESPQHTHGITVTKDGVTVAKAIDLMDPIENLAVKMMKEASEHCCLASALLYSRLLPIACCLFI
jgi:chaperonin GroEL (HSP60 family)